MIVYLATNTVNGKQYVGQTTSTLERRWQKHYQSARAKNQRHYKISRALVKYGKNNFTVEVLAVCKNKTDMDKKEKYFIKTLETREKGYNITSGGEGAVGYRHTSASKLKMHTAQLGNTKMLGKHTSLLQKQRASETWLGRKHTAEAKAKMRTAALLRHRERNNKGQYS